MAGDLLCLFPAKSGRVAVASGWAYGHRGGNPARLGERVCACVVLRPGESLTLDELVLFLRDKIATEQPGSAETRGRGTIWPKGGDISVGPYSSTAPSVMRSATMPRILSRMRDPP